MIEITMPRLSDTMTEGAISTWRKQPGDTVAVGDPLVEIETDKAVMEYEAYQAGTLAQILVPEGASADIGAPIALIDDGGGEKAVAEEAPSSVTDDKGVQVRKNGSRPPASPLVRKLAREHHLDLSGVTGTGPGGRIIRADIAGLLDAPAMSTAPAPPPTPPAPPTPPPDEPERALGQPLAGPNAYSARGEGGGGADPSASVTPDGADALRGSRRVPVSSVRRVIARRLSESAREVPHFYMTAAADAEELMALRGSLNARLTAAGRAKVSVNDLLIRAVALALREHPEVNASWGGDDALLVHDRVNIGVAVAAESGLIVPVITDADTKTVTQLGREAKHLVSLAGERKLTPAQTSGGTFTISNLGMFGVQEFTAIINPPEAAILAVGGTTREPAAVGEEIVPRYRMRYTLSSDHRVIDGALAARFLATLTGLIESPWLIIA